MRRTFEGIGILALAALFWITYRAMSGPDPLPGRIPVHFDMAGRPNGWGSSASLFLLPCIALVIYIGISMGTKNPASFNFPVRVTPANRPRLEALALRMVGFIKVEMVCLFLWIQTSIIDSARNQTLGLPMWLMPISIGVIFGTIGWHIVAMRRTAAFD